MSGVQRVAMDDGCRIACDYTPCGDAPAVVLSPSLGTAMGLFDAQREALAGRYSVVRYDPRGHGASDTPTGACSLDRLGRDVVQLLDALEIARAHFVGVSLGGMAGQWLGYRAPERLLSLTLANTSAFMGPPSGWSERIAAVLDDGMPSIVEPVIERWFTPGFRKDASTDVARVADMLKTTRPQGYAGCCAAIRDMDLRPTTPLIDAPTMVISGSQDPATPPDHGKFLANAIPNARLASLEAAHLSNVERPDQFNTVLLDFLEEL